MLSRAGVNPRCFLISAQAHILADRKVTTLLTLAATTISSLTIGLSPPLAAAFYKGGIDGLATAFAQLAKRLFPFEQRGLVHSYWARNSALFLN